MKKRILFLVLFVLIAFHAVSQNAKNSGGGSPFYLIPILETVFSGDLRWRPDWPQELPVDAFSVSKNYSRIELSNDDNNFSVRRDGRGRLVEFPYFSIDSDAKESYAIVQTSFSPDGSLQKMTVILKNNSSDSKSNSSKGEEKTVNIEFPVGFLPFSDISPGGSFNPIKVSSGDEIYYLFVFETPSFLTETWYDGEGNMLVFCKALVNHNFNNSWRVSSLQIYEKEDISFVDNYYEAGGNISELSFISTTDDNDEEKTFSALYRDKKPVFWKTDDFQYEMQWNVKDFLTIVKEIGEDGVEYRYEYETDSSGNWVKRQETALSGINLLVPQPSKSRGVWNRRIVYGEASGR